MLQIVTEFCLLHLTASHAGCKYFFLSSKVHTENFSRRYMCVCIATAVDFSIQVQMNQWKIVWLPVWMNLMLLLEVVLSLVRVVLFIPEKLWPSKQWIKYLFDFVKTSLSLKDLINASISSIKLTKQTVIINIADRIPSVGWRLKPEILAQGD